MAEHFHYPPEIFNILVDTIPLLCRSKKYDAHGLLHAAQTEPHRQSVQLRPVRYRTRDVFSSIEETSRAKIKFAEVLRLVPAARKAATDALAQSEGVTMPCRAGASMPLLILKGNLS